MAPRFSFDVLSDGSLALRLGDACIEASAKRARRELADSLLAGQEPSVALEALVELLDQFLTTTDFRRLRGDHPELAGGTPCHVRIYRVPDGGVRWQKGASA